MPVIQTMVGQSVSFSDELEFFDEHGLEIGRFIPCSDRFCIEATGVSNDAILVKSPNEQIDSESLRKSTRAIQNALKKRSSVTERELRLEGFRVYVRTTPGSYVRVKSDPEKDALTWYLSWLNGTHLNWYQLNLREIRKGSGESHISHIVDVKESFLGSKSLPSLHQAGLIGTRVGTHPVWNSPLNIAVSFETSVGREHSFTDMTSLFSSGDDSPEIGLNTAWIQEGVCPDLMLKTVRVIVAKIEGLWYNELERNNKCCNFP